MRLASLSSAYVFWHFVVELAIDGSIWLGVGHESRALYYYLGGILTCRFKTLR